MPAPHFTLPSPHSTEGNPGTPVDASTLAADEWSLQRTAVLTLIAAVIAAAALLIVWERQVALLLFGGIVLATALEPLIRWLISTCKMPRTYATILVFATFSLILVGLIAFAVPEVIAQSQAVIEKLPAWYEQSRSSLMDSPFRSLRILGGYLPVEMPSIWNMGMLNAELGAGSASPLDVVNQVGMAFFGILAVGVLGFYWSMHEETTIRSLLLLAPEHRRPFYQSMTDEVLQKLGGYVRGQLILCAAVFVLSLIAYLVLGLPYALLLALIAGLLEAVPIIGPTLGAIPAIIVALSLGPQQTALVIGAAMMIQTIENYFLVPKVMDRSVGISAVVTLLGIVTCGALFGIIGAVFAIPLAAIGQTLLERFVLQTDFKAKKFTGPRDSAGVLHYQLMDLINDLKRQQRQKDTPIDPWTTESFAELETIAVALDEAVTKPDDADDNATNERLPTASVRS